MEQPPLVDGRADDALALDHYGFSWIRKALAEEAVSVRPSGLWAESFMLPLN